MTILTKYLRGTPYVCKTRDDGSIVIAKPDGNTCYFPGEYNIKLKNKVCIYLDYLHIGIDVNGEEGPNNETDQFLIYLNVTEGITSDIPQ